MEYEVKIYNYEERKIYIDLLGTTDYIELVIGGKEGRDGDEKSFIWTERVSEPKIENFYTKNKVFEGKVDIPFDFEKDYCYIRDFKKLEKLIDWLYSEGIILLHHRSIIWNSGADTTEKCPYSIYEQKKEGYTLTVNEFYNSLQFRDTLISFKYCGDWFIGVNKGIVYNRLTIENCIALDQDEEWLSPNHRFNSYEDIDQIWVHKDRGAIVNLYKALLNSGMTLTQVRAFRSCVLSESHGKGINVDDFCRRKEGNVYPEVTKGNVEEALTRIHDSESKVHGSNFWESLDLKAGGMEAGVHYLPFEAIRNKHATLAEKRTNIKSTGLLKLSVRKEEVETKEDRPIKLKVIKVKLI